MGTRITASMGYVLMLAQDGADLFTGISTRDRVRRGVAWNGRAKTVQTLKAAGHVNEENTVTPSGAAALRGFCERVNRKRRA